MVKRTWLLIFPALALAACSGTSATTASTQAPASEWTVHEESSFSLSYPPEWESFTVNAAMTQNLDELLGGAIDSFDGGIVLAAGLPTSSSGFSPNVNVVAETPPSSITNFQDYAAESRKGLEQVFATYEATDEQSMVIGGNDAVLLTGSYAVSELVPEAEERWWLVQLITLDGPVGWTVSCGTAALEEIDAAPDLATCRDVVATFVPKAHRQ